MSTTYVWEIINLETRTEGSNIDSVVLAHWHKIAIGEDDVRSRFIGATPLSSSSTTNFTPYADLTESQIIAWVQASMDEEQERHINAFLEEGLEAERNPQVMKANPWDL